MSNRFDQNLEKLGITLPAPVAALANYVPFVQTGNLLSISGQIPMDSDGNFPYLGKVGVEVSEEDAVKAARLCAINIISQARIACGGDLERIVRIVKLGAFINCQERFARHPAIVNGASDLMVAVFGDVGKHSRSAVGANSLPLNIPVEIDALIEIS